MSGVDTKKGNSLPLKSNTDHTNLIKSQMHITPFGTSSLTHSCLPSLRVMHTWVIHFCLGRLRVMHSTRARDTLCAYAKHCTHTQSVGNSQQKFHASSPLWVHSCAVPYISQLKWKKGFTAARQFGGPSVSLQASNKSKCQWIFNPITFKLWLLLDFLHGGVQGMLCEHEGTSRHRMRPQAFPENKFFGCQINSNLFYFMVSVIVLSQLPMGGRRHIYHRLDLNKLFSHSKFP